MQYLNICIVCIIEKWIDAISLENQDDSTEYNKGWLIPHNSGVNMWYKSTSNNGFPALMSSEMGYVAISQNVITQAAGPI